MGYIQVPSRKIAPNHDIAVTLLLHLVASVVSIKNVLSLGKQPKPGQIFFICNVNLNLFKEPQTNLRKFCSFSEVMANRLQVGYIFFEDLTCEDQKQIIDYARHRLLTEVNLAIFTMCPFEFLLCRWKLSPIQDSITFIKNSSEKSEFGHIPTSDTILKRTLENFSSEFTKLGLSPFLVNLLINMPQLDRDALGSFLMYIESFYIKSVEKIRCTSKSAKKQRHDKRCYHKVGKRAIKEKDDTPRIHKFFVTQFENCLSICPLTFFFNTSEILARQSREYVYIPQRQNSVIQRLFNFLKQVERETLKVPDQFKTSEQSYQLIKRFKKLMHWTSQSCPQAQKFYGIPKNLDSFCFNFQNSVLDRHRASFIHRDIRAQLFEVLENFRFVFRKPQNESIIFGQLKETWDNFQDTNINPTSLKNREILRKFVESIFENHTFNKSKLAMKQNLIRMNFLERKLANFCHLSKNVKRSKILFNKHVSHFDYCSKIVSRSSRLHRLRLLRSSKAPTPTRPVTKIVFNPTYSVDPDCQVFPTTTLQLLSAPESASHQHGEKKEVQKQKSPGNWPLA